MAQQATLPGHWTREQMVELLQTNDRAVARALVVLYERQTADEQESETTRHHNGMGFSAFDAEILSSFAKQVKAGRTLTARQLEVARKKADAVRPPALRGGEPEGG